MSEILQPIKRKGNPNFGNKKEEGQSQVPDNYNNQYIFQLLKTHEKQKPITSQLGDKEGGYIVNVFQPWFAVVNSGVAWDPNYIPKGKTEKGGQRRWRFLHNYPDTIWVDEQIDPEPTKEDLADDRNDIVFRNGVLRVFGHEERKLQALMLNNTFDGCVRPLKNLPKEFTLLNQDKIDKEVLESLDAAFEAEKAARNATLEEMYAVGYYFGIDMTKSDDAIRKEFINKARQNPQLFNREFVNPKNKYKYVFLLGLEDNIISSTINSGRITIVETNVVKFELKTGDAAEELAQLCMSEHKEAMALYNILNKKYQ
jgi:hypothetical protein